MESPWAMASMLSPHATRPWRRRIAARRCVAVYCAAAMCHDAVGLACSGCAAGRHAATYSPRASAGTPTACQAVRTPDHPSAHCPQPSAMPRTGRAPPWPAPRAIRPAPARPVAAGGGGPQRDDLRRAAVLHAGRLPDGPRRPHGRGAAALWPGPHLRQRAELRHRLPGCRGERAAPPPPRASGGRALSRAMSVGCA